MQQELEHLRTSSSSLFIFVACRTEFSVEELDILIFLIDDLIL